LSGTDIEQAPSFGKIVKAVRNKKTDNLAIGELSAMNIQLTENMIRERASEQSFNKGRDYYRGGAIFDPTW
jgi:hypothetical protein